MTIVVISCCLGDYDALLVLMMLPRMTFKAELVMEQLKQQHNFDDAMGSLSTMTPAKADQLAFVSLLIFKLTSLIMLVRQANRSVSLSLYLGAWFRMPLVRTSQYSSLYAQGTLFRTPGFRTPLISPFQSVLPTTLSGHLCSLEIGHQLVRT